MKKLFILSALALLVGCRATLSPDGGYQDQRFWFVMDQTLADSKDALDGFVLFELQNRVELQDKHLESVTAAADAIRTNAPVWFNVAWLARGAYTNALLGGASASTVSQASNALSLAVSDIQTKVKINASITNALTP